MASLKNKTFDQIAASLKLKVLDTEKLADYLKIDILISVYRRNPKNEYEQEINKKVAKAYEDWTGRKFESFLADSITPTRLVGPPGHGKTTVMRVAAKMVADSLGMNFIQDPSTDFVPSYKDFILSTKKYDLNLFNISGFKFLLLENLVNLSAKDKNTAIDTIVNLKNDDSVYVGITDNIYNYKNKDSFFKIINNKLVIYFTIDRLENFVNRIMNCYADSLADVAVISFLRRQPQSFAAVPETDKETKIINYGFACPRNWEAFINEARKTLHKNGGRGIGEVAAYEEIRDKGLSILGPEVGEKFAAYFHSMMQGADPLAYNTVTEGKLNKERIQQLYGKGTSAEQQQFGYQFASALVDYAVNYIRESKDQDIVEGTKRFARGLYALQDGEFAYGLNYFKDRLAAQVPKYAKPEEGRPRTKVLDSKWKVEIAKIFGDIANEQNNAPVENNLSNKIFLCRSSLKLGSLKN